MTGDTAPSRNCHPLAHRYDGDWANGKISGLGTLQYADGDRVPFVASRRHTFRMGAPVRPALPRFGGPMPCRSIPVIEYAPGCGMRRATTARLAALHLQHTCFVTQRRHRVPRPDGRSREGVYAARQTVRWDVWPRSRQYVGSWLNGKMHGRGVYAYSQGDRCAL